MTQFFTNTLSKRSKVYLVGAGPGDPGLLTIKAQSVLQQADVLIYDYLANSSFLKFVPAHAELINAGKRHGQHTIPQAQINELIVQKAQENKIVVRLKGGDPFIFGRGGEELVRVAQLGIPFEVVPGVSSAIAVPAYVGIPLTHRDYSANVVFLTGMEHPEKPQTLIAWEAIAKIGTIVVLMGLSTMDQVVDNLIAHGRDPETQVAVVQWGTWPQQRSLKGTLATIVSKVKQENFEPPVLTIIGEVCRFYDTFNWSENRPLHQQRILVTREEGPGTSLSEKLQELGGDVFHFPTISIQEPTSWAAFDEVVRQAKTMDWVIFTSLNGIEKSFQRLEQLQKDARVFPAHIACVGESTAQYLKQFNLIADVVPDHYQSEGLMERLKTFDFENQHVWLPQAEVTREALKDNLKKRGALLHPTPVYRNELPSADPTLLIKKLQNQELDWITFTSSSTVSHLMTLLSTEGTDVLKNLPPKIACIGEVTANTVREHGLPVSLVAEQQNIEGLVQSLVQACLNKNEKKS
ncbi:uroporphyrinogen-III C-methyltransferase [Deltaproteobacteria bacterium TL4]